MYKIWIMSIFSDNLRARIEGCSLSQGKIADMIGELRPNFNQAVSGKRALTDVQLRKLSNIPELNLSYEELILWKMQDELFKMSEKYPLLKRHLEYSPPDKWQKEIEEAKNKPPKREAC